MKKTFLIVVALAVLFSINIALAKNQPNGTPFAALWNIITGLQDQIDELEERIVVLEGPGCVSEPEVCDDVDNDCDGDIDEDNVCDPTACAEEGQACDGDDADLCQMGVTFCDSSGAPQCIDDIPNFIEICDGFDNDCDGEVDEDFSYLGLAIGDACGIGECAGGTVICLSDIEATCSTLDQATAETCDGFDNDCDGLIDEDFLNLGLACDGADSDQCMNGFYTCMFNGSGAECTNEYPTNIMEACNGVDDDCDGLTDEDNVCTPDGAPCNDGNLCTVNDIYIDGVCVGGALKVCDDDNPCTIDSCGPASDCIFNVNTSGACDDGDSCTQQDACDGQGSCVGIPIPSCL